MRLMTDMLLNSLWRGMHRGHRGQGRAAALILHGAAAFVLFISLMGAVGVRAQSNGEMQALINRLDLIQRDLNALQKQFYRGEKPTPPAGEGPVSPVGAGNEKAVALLTVRINALEQELRKLTGRLEEVQFRMNSVTRRLDKLVEDIDFRLTGIEKRLEERSAAERSRESGPSPTAEAPSEAPASAEQPGSSGANEARPPLKADLAPKVLGTIRPEDLKKVGRPAAGGGEGKAASAAPAASGASPVAASGEEDPKQAYQAAFSILKRGDFPAAEQAFREFLSRYPDHTLSANAQYWLGETFYVRKDYDNAAAAFLQGYQKYPESAKGPDFLLKLGMSLRRSGNNEEACAAFAELSDKYPQMSATIRQRLRQESAAAKCS